MDNKKTTDEIRLLVESKLKGEYTVLDNSKTLENNTMVYFVYFDREEGFFIMWWIQNDKQEINQIMDRSMGAS